MATKDLGGDSGTTAQVGQEGAHSNFPPFDAGTFPSQLVWFAIAFGFLYWYLSKRGLPALGAVIEGRKARNRGRPRRSDGDAAEGRRGGGRA